MTVSDTGTPAPLASPPTKRKFQLFASPGANSDSMMSIPLFGAVILGVSVFLAWITPNFTAIDLPLNLIWSDVWGYSAEGLWLGWIVFGIAVVGFIAAAVPVTKSWQVFVVGIVAVALVGMFFRAAVATDSFNLIRAGAYAAAIGALLMLVPRGR